MQDENEVIDDVVIHEEVIDDVVEDVNDEVDVESNEEESGEEEIIIQIGEEVITNENEKDPKLVRELRKLAREKEKRIKELESRLKQESAPVKQELSKKPHLGDEDIDYDEEKYEAALLKYNDEKREHDNRAKAEAEARQNEIKAAQDKIANFETAKKALNVTDYEEAEAVVSESFDNNQQNIILFGSDDPALLVYAIGKSPAKAKEFAAEKDLAKLAFKLGKFEGQLKVTNRAKPPAPEKVVTGNVGFSGSSDATLEKLRSKAEKSGDMSEVMAYKRKLKAQGK